MPRKLITKSPAEFKAAVNAKINEQLTVRINDLYNKAVDAINDGENKITMAEGDLEILPAVGGLLEEQGFLICRFLGDQALIHTKTLHEAPEVPRPGKKD